MKAMPSSRNMPSSEIFAGASVLLLQSKIDLKLIAHKILKAAVYYFACAANICIIKTKDLFVTTVYSIIQLKP